MNERDFWLGFSVFPGIGPVKFGNLLKQFGSAKDAWKASGKDLKPIVGKMLFPKFDDFRQSFPFEGYKKELQRKNVWFITLQDKEYPGLLKLIKKPPFVIFGKGELGILGKLGELKASIAVVGTRKITEYGKEVTEMFVSQLVENGFIIVSGLALGVDAVAHATAITNNGLTIAVLGCGVDCCLPSENSGLYDRILQQGGVILSELPLGHPPNVGSFPARNRIVAGLSVGVLVTEGAEDSGSLITAQCAFSEGRPVFAVPGPITSQLSRGPFKLIQKGAKLVTSAEEVIKELGIRPALSARLAKREAEGNHELGKGDPTSSRSAGLRGASKEETMILSLLENEAMHFDALVRKTGFSSSKLGSLLTFMEMKGIIKSGNGTFSL